jgi:hypothetical protein
MLVVIAFFWWREREKNLRRKISDGANYFDHGTEDVTCVGRRKKNTFGCGR